MNKGDQFGIMSKILGFRNKTVKAAICILLVSMSLMLFGCSDVMHVVNREIFGPSAVNDFIELKDVKLEEITELVCDPGDDACISGSDYDKLGKLKNLESVTFVGIGFETDAQNFFEELTKLDNLKSVTIKGSRIGSVSKLKEIKGLEELHIITGVYSGSKDKIDDLDELTKISTLRVLDLQNVFPDGMPDLSEVDNLEELTISSYDIHEIPYEYANWSNLKKLSFRATGIREIDDRIIRELDNLESLDVSYTKIEDVSFVIDMPQLKEFMYRKHSTCDANVDILKQHPNYDESWIKD